MKYYEIVDVTSTEEFVEFEGTDYSAALEAKEEALRLFNDGLTSSEKKGRYIECRVWDLPDDTDLTDKMQISFAICNCVGYNLF